MSFPPDHLLPRSRTQAWKLLLTPQPPKLPWWYALVTFFDKVWP
jgi:hypothetical protein